MGKVEGGMKCVKYLLFIFNFIFWLMGSLVLAVGLWLRFDPETVALLNGDGAPDTFFYGVYILIIAGSLVMLVGFFGCCGAIRESQCLLGSIIEDVQNYYIKSYNDNKNNNTMIQNSYHKVLNCCGTSQSFCPEAPADTKDCEVGIKEFFNSKLYIIGYVGIGIAGVMVIGMIFSMVLCCAIRNSREIM
ncbi:CD9 antigen isoform X3 [Oncorhynchus mykiss]|uniref:CD9 antigen isoform X3 n=1 Tax=Oncorhynchus mykiss TaxID=8022 RepID=UPI001878E15F|nr:CD9 antigen isoform X3 [Oncorhynchus mykiss]